MEWDPKKRPAENVCPKLCCVHWAPRGGTAWLATLSTSTCKSTEKVLRTKDAWVTFPVDSLERLHGVSLTDNASSHTESLHREGSVRGLPSRGGVGGTGSWHGDRRRSSMGERSCRSVLSCFRPTWRRVFQIR